MKKVTIASPLVILFSGPLTDLAADDNPGPECRDYAKQHNQKLPVHICFLIFHAGTSAAQQLPVFSNSSIVCSHVESRTVDVDMHDGQTLASPVPADNVLM